MAKLKQTVTQAIADFDGIETAIEECGIDVPYDTNTSEYGNLVKEVYAKGIADGGGEPLVVNADTHYDFPSVGSVNVIYKAYKEKLIYQWNATELKYEVLGSTTEMPDIEIINGGDSFV